MEETNPREELYNQFKASLREPVSDRYFSEDELVEIFDYAGDVVDDYAQFEVLFCAARLYPDSQPLIDRKALFYLDTTESDDNPDSPTAKAFVADNPEMTSPLMDIVRMDVNPPENPSEGLDYFLEQYELLSDEEIIRLVQAACNMGAYQWVVDNLDRLRKKVTFQPTLLYEVMDKATSAGDNSTVLKMTEELIEAEPFVSGYWAAQFRALVQLGRDADARNCFDYAKSIGASDEDTICYLAETIGESAPYLIDEGIAMLDDWLATDPSNYRVFTLRGMLMLQKQQFEPLERDLTEFTQKYGVDSNSLRHMFLLNNPNAANFLRSELQKGNGVFTAAELDDLLDTLHMNSNSQAMYELATVLNEFMNNHVPLPLAQYWAEAMFNLQKYDEVIALFFKYPKEELLNFLKFPPRGPAFWYIALLSFLHSGSSVESVVGLQELRDSIIEQIQSSPMPVKMNYITLCSLVSELIHHPQSDSQFWSSYNPLG